MLHSLTPGLSRTTARPIRPRTTGSLLASLGRVVNEQLADGERWSSWQLADERLAPFAGLQAVRAAWVEKTDAPVRGAVAALAVIGSVRGGDDDLAALSTLILLRPGIAALADRVHDLCDPEDVVSTVWFEIRRMEPGAGPGAPHHLLKRAHQRLLRENRRFADLPIGDLVPAAASQEVPEDPRAEFTELLRWASAHGVVPPEEAALLVEIAIAERDGASPGEALRIAGDRRGWAARTARSHRQRALARLRTALPAYLAATA